MKLRTTYCDKCRHKYDAAVWDRCPVCMVGSGLTPGEIIPLAPGQEIQLVPSSDSVNHPSHYTAHPSGVECIDVTEHMNFNVGNAVKYLWRADLKNDPIENLRKAIWYIEREIQRRTAATKES